MEDVVIFLCMYMYFQTLLCYSYTYDMICVIFKIKYKLYRVSVSPPNEKFWVRT
jgi:hypothetical protein